MEIDSKTEIKTEFSERKKQLEQQIDHLDNFITDLKSHKISLENANRQLEQLAVQETDAVKKAKYFAAIRTNIEILTKIFNSMSELESIKHRYHKEINDITIGKFRLLDVDIRKIDEGLKNGGENLSEFFEKLGNAMSGVGKAQASTIKTNLDKDPEYKL
jgi:translation initiation factor 2B subunit (eIF-2B alpha/beta/delta family)